MIKNQKLKIKNQQGFTLLEVIISLGIAGVMVAIVIGIQFLVRESYSFSLNAVLTVDHANSGIQQLTRVIRNGRSGDNGAFILEVVGDQELVIYSNTDDQPDTERVRYFLEGNELKRGVIKPTSFPFQYLPENETVSTISEYITSGIEPIFYYYNGNWPDDQTNNPLPLSERLSDTRFIQVVLKVNVNPDRPTGEYLLKSYAQLRNLKDNL